MFEHIIIIDFISLMHYTYQSFVLNHVAIYYEMNIVDTVKNQTAKRLIIVEIFKEEEVFRG